MTSNLVGSHRTLRLSRPPPGIFCKSYQCHSMACLDREGLEFGDKIIMPQAAFQEAHRLRLKLPLLFKLVNADATSRRIIGTVFLPYWMMQSLLLVEGARVELRSMLRPPAGSFVRFKPHDDTFLDLAARQGPRALMEGALRRYSVLSEGVTILVQHEGENFYLDVVEVRTFATSAFHVDDGAPATSPPEVAAPGKRVRLVCLLGDLDLEVEFCAPHASLPRQGSAERSSEHRAYRDLEGLPANLVDDNDRNPNWHQSQGSVNEISPSSDPGLQASTPLSAVDRAAGFKGGKSKQEGRLGLPWPLPAPARAKRGCEGGGSASGLAMETPRRKTGELGIKPPAPPSLISKYRAFSGKCMSLLGGRVKKCRSSGKSVESADTKRSNSYDEHESSPRAMTPALPAARSAATTAGIGPVETEAQVAPGIVAPDCPGEGGRAIEGSNISSEHCLAGGDGRAAADHGPPSVPEPRRVSSEGGRQLGEGASPVVPVTRGRGQPCRATATDAAAVAAGVLLSAEMMTACGRCGALVPTANLPLHELRCCSSKAVRRRKHPPHAPPTEPCTNPEKSSSAIPRAPCSKEEEVDTTTSAAPKSSTTTAAASTARFPCAYCGLAFGSAGPAREHEVTCGTRTERCDRCCSHVPRRNAESHRQPGGGCDAAIAAGEEHEHQVLAAGQSSLALYGSGNGGGGDGGGGGRRDSGPIGGRFDALLAEAVRSSKAASTALAEARVENDARMQEVVGAMSPPRGGGVLLRLRSDSSGHGRVDEPEEVAVDSSEGVANGRSGGLGATTDALGIGCTDKGTGTGGTHRPPTHDGESGRHPHPQTTGASAASPSSPSLSSLVVDQEPLNRARFPASSRVTPDPSAPSNQPSPSSHTGIEVSVAESVPREVLSPHRSGSSEGARRPASRSWACPRCTLINPLSLEACEACGFAPGSTEKVSSGAISGGSPPGTDRSSESGRSGGSVAGMVVGGTSAAALQVPAEGGRRGAAVPITRADIDAAVQAAGEEGRSPTGGSSPRLISQTTSMPAPFLAAAAAAFPPDVVSPSPGRGRALKESRTHAAARRNPPAAALLLSSLPVVGSSESTRASGSAPQPGGGRNPSVARSSSGALEGNDAEHALPLHARHTAPAPSSSVFSVVGTRSGLVEAAETGGTGPRGGRFLRSTATFFVPADIRPLQPRGGRKEASAPQGGVRVVRQRQQQQQHEHTTQVSTRTRARKPKARTERRRRLMGPPRRLGGVHRPSRLRYEPSSLMAPSGPAPPADTTTATAAVSTQRSGWVREAAGPHDRRHGREQQTESRGSFSPPASSSRSRPKTLIRGVLGGGGDGGRGTQPPARPRPSPAAPACDVSLSILGRSQAPGGTSRVAQVPGGGRVSIGGAQVGEVPRRPGQENDVALSFRQEVGGGVGVWGRRYGEGNGEGRAAVPAVGVAPLKLRRRVNDARVLEPLVAR